MKYLTIGGKLYHQDNTTFIHVSTDDRTHFQSLFDRGDNGWVVEKDKNVIKTPPYRHVSIQGIDNHYITSVLIATAGS